MPRGRREGGARQAFFKGLRARALAAWTSRGGYAYDDVLYAVSYPYREGDVERVLAWAGRPGERGKLPALARLNGLLTNSLYPELAARAPEGLSAQAWSAVLHFLDPSYPLATPAAHRALGALGFEVAPALTLTAYPSYLAAFDELKEAAPVWAVPETNWYLARVLEVGLEALANEGAPGRGRAAAAGS